MEDHKEGIVLFCSSCHITPLQNYDLIKNWPKLETRKKPNCFNIKVSEIKRQGMLVLERIMEPLGTLCYLLFCCLKYHLPAQ